MSSGCQISFLVFAQPQNRLNMFPSHLSRSRGRELSPSLGIFLRSEVRHSAATAPLLSVFNLLSVLTQGGLFIRSRLGCTFVFYVNLLEIKFCPLMWCWLCFVDGTKRNDSRRERNFIFRFKSSFIPLHWPGRLILSKNRTNGVQWLGFYTVNLWFRHVKIEQRRQFFSPSCLPRHWPLSMLIRRCEIGCAHCMLMLKRHVCAASNIRIVPSDVKPHQINADWVSLPGCSLHCDTQGFQPNAFFRISALVSL